MRSVSQPGDVDMRLLSAESLSVVLMMEQLEADQRRSIGRIVQAIFESADARSELRRVHRAGHAALSGSAQ